MQPVYITTITPTNSLRLQVPDAYIFFIVSGAAYAL